MIKTVVYLVVFIVVFVSVSAILFNVYGKFINDIIDKIKGIMKKM